MHAQPDHGPDDPSTATIRERFIDGLELAALRRPSIVDFFEALPRRVGDHVRSIFEGDDVDDSISGPTELPTDTLETIEGIGDLLEDIVHTLRDEGFPLDPRQATSSPLPIEELSTEAQAQMDRVDGGATEVLQRLSTISDEEWLDRTDEPLIDRMRRAVGELSWQLRTLRIASNDDEAGQAEAGA